jgi:hypothetical protein
MPAMVEKARSIRLQLGIEGIIVEIGIVDVDRQVLLVFG